MQADASRTSVCGINGKPGLDVTGYPPLVLLMRGRGFDPRKQNITVKNGTVRGFLAGIQFEGSGGQGRLIEDVRADLNTAARIVVFGTGNIVRNNQIISTGGSTIVSGPDSFIFGIYVEGSGNRAINNDINGVTQGAAFGASGISVGKFSVQSIGAGRPDRGHCGGSQAPTRAREPHTCS
jgi:hypothetical protein